LRENGGGGRISDERTASRGFRVHLEGRMKTGRARFSLKNLPNFSTRETVVRRDTPPWAENVYVRLMSCPSDLRLPDVQGGNPLRDREIEPEEVRPDLQRRR